MGRGVAIVGAGYAGMAAAVTLAARGERVTVLESGPLPGGRARRVQSQGETLDNGQHILIGAYHELLRLMRVVEVPTEAVLRLPLELRFADGFALRALWLPPPLGLLSGLLLCRRLPIGERVAVIRFLNFLKRTSFQVDEDLCVGELLRQHKQEGLIGHYLWRPLCVSALNTPPEIASAQVFCTVLRNSLAGEPGDADLLLPRIDLSKLFPEPAAEFVRRNGGEVRCGESVRDLASIRQEFGRVIVAVGPHQLKALLPELAPDFAYQPIYTCYLQYAERVKLPFPMLGLAHGLVQWAFDRGALLGERGRIACVISAQGDHQQLELDELATLCHRELARALPGLPEPRWTRVIAEKRATVACTPAMKTLIAKLAIPGIVLAGDYTDPEYPPTLEAAVRSGVRAAQVIGNAQGTA